MGVLIRGALPSLLQIGSLARICKMHVESPFSSIQCVAGSSADDSDLDDKMFDTRKPSVVRKMFTMGMISIGIMPRKEREVEKEIEKQKQRFKPDSLAALTQRTHFSRREIQMLYRGFKEDEKTHADCTEYSKMVFESFDDDGNGEISFEEFVEGLSVLCRGTDEQRLLWVFKVYDHDRKGYFIKQDLFRAVRGVYDLLGQSVKPPIKGNDVMRHVTQVFDGKFDKNKNGQITCDQFLTVCKDDPTIQKSLGVFRGVY